MKINKNQKSSFSKKSVKRYDFRKKKRIVANYMLGVYSAREILEKYGISRIMLLNWLGWYYKYFQSKNYKSANYGKGKLRKEKSSVGKTDPGVGSSGKRSKGVIEKGGDNKSEPATIAGSGASRLSGFGGSQKLKKKYWREIVVQLKEDYPQSTMAELCKLFGKSRQAWYQGENADIKQFYEEEVILEEVKRIRKYLKKCGGRKLYHLMKSFLKQKKIKIGRDKFFDLLRRHNLLIKKRKKTAKTTNSNHSFRKYPNLIKELEVRMSNQLWVSDITYIRLPRTFCYLSLITDAYSRKIVGWHLAEDLKAESTLKALEMALKQLPKKHKQLIHHSDRGLQYCSRMYVALLQKYDIKISMTEQGDPYENILAERMNRTIKEEFIEMTSYVTYQEARTIVKDAVKLYNGMRPHASLDYLTPDQAHSLEGILKRRWKNKVV